MQLGEAESPITSINVTPLVDILLVLLIIFMATTPLIHRRLLKVSVPKAANASASAEKALSIVYGADHRILFGGRFMTAGELAQALAAQVRLNPDLRVVLAADKSLGYGDVVALLDAAKGAGVSRIGLEVVHP